MGKQVLVIGAGGREHALAWKLAQSPEVSRVFCAPGNGGIAAQAECVSLPDAAAMTKFCKEKKIDLAVIGPEQPLVEGVSDALREAGVAVFGPSRAAARLEASKSFTKHLCRKYNIPTAAYEAFADAPAAKAYLKKHGYPAVVKADGLAAGKGVIIAQNAREAEEAVDSMFSGAFGEAGRQVVIEEFLEGEEASFFALCDGEEAVPFSHAQDHKRAYDGDKGPNTGGMGTYAPAPVMTEWMQGEVMERIVLPTVHAMRREGNPYAGVLFAGLMISPSGPKLLEYNVRFGDPETQVLMRRLESDLYPLLAACARGHLADVADIRFRKAAALCVVMASKGYPGSYRKGTEIRGLDEASAIPGVVVFHAGTEEKDGKMLATGGRVLGVTALGDAIQQAQASAYRAVDAIDWPEGFCRRDIGWRAVKAA